jgi:hypothetical protein
MDEAFPRDKLPKLSATMKNGAALITAAITSETPVIYITNNPDTLTPKATRRFAQRAKK